MKKMKIAATITLISLVAVAATAYALLPHDCILFR
jgi:hypothetical protein